MTRRRWGRTERLDWWRAVLDETRELIGDSLERRRHEERATWAEDLASLRKMFGGITTGAGGVASTDGGGMSPKPGR